MFLLKITIHLAKKSSIPKVQEHPLSGPISVPPFGTGNFPSYFRSGIVSVSPIQEVPSSLVQSRLKRAQERRPQCHININWALLWHKFLLKPYTLVGPTVSRPLSCFMLRELSAKCKSETGLEVPVMPCHYKP